MLLVTPPISGPRLFTAYPLGLMYLAAAIRRVGHEVELRDLYSLGGALNAGGFDVVGVTGMSFQHHEILGVCREAKNSGAVTVVGGPHATALPELILGDDAVDYVVRGEGDLVFPAFLEAVSHGINPYTTGICFKSKPNSHITPPHFIDDIDALPFPAWNLVDVKRYSDSPHGLFHERTPIGCVMTSRGCPMRCGFCAGHVVSGRKWRSHSVRRVLFETNFLARKKGIRELHIEDDNFTLDLARAKAILRGIVDDGLDLSIAFPNGVRIDRLDEELLQLMEKAGVYSLTFGIESGSDNVLRLMGKGFDRALVERQLAKVKRYGFKTQGFFIVGWPWETAAEIEATIDFATRLPLDAAYFGVYSPLPGSSDFERLTEEGKISIDTLDWSDAHSSRGVETSLHIPLEEVKRLQRKAYRRFYLRPSRMVKTLLRLRGAGQLRGLLSRWKAVG